MKDYVALARAYEAGVIAGEIPACQSVRLACERNERDRMRVGSDDWPYTFDAEKASKICRFAELLPHIKGPKAKVVGKDDQGRNLWATIELEPWQCWILTTMFGWVRADGLRRFRVALVLIPRKNAKSTLGAIIALYMLTADGEGGPECYSAATTRDQAKAVAEIAWEMAKRSPQFCEYYGVRVGSETTRSLATPHTAGKFMPLSADANSLDGLNVSCAVVDELHAHAKAAVWNVLDTGTGARPQPYLIGITTAGVDLGGICYTKLGYLEKVLQRVVEDDTLFGLNYTIDPEDDIRLERVQRKANPNYGVSVMPDDLQRKVKEAQVTQAALNNVLTKHFNVWIKAEASWLPVDLWLACGDAGLRLEDVSDLPCWIGVDLAEVKDFAAIVLVFKRDADHYVVIPRLYLPEDAIEKMPVAQLSGWSREGHIIVTTGNQADYQRIEQDLVTLCERLRVQEIDFDRALAAQMQQNLLRHFEPSLGVDGAARFVVTVRQSLETMNPAMQLTERLVLAKGLEHDANPVMTWMVSNVVIELRNDERYPRKAGGKDSVNKIDGPVALFTALSRAMQGLNGTSVYETRGALSF
jgi:phage terminase large subunit-like protein